MYELYILIRNKWRLIEKVNTINEVDISINYIYNTYPKRTIQVIKDDKVLCCLDGSDYQKFWFYNKFILRRDDNFDYIKEYEKVKQFRKF